MIDFVGVELPRTLRREATSLYELMLVSWVRHELHSVPRGTSMLESGPTFDLRHVGGHKSWDSSRRGARVATTQGHHRQRERRETSVRTMAGHMKRQGAALPLRRAATTATLAQAWLEPTPGKAQAVRYPCKGDHAPAARRNLPIALSTPRNLSL